MKNKNPHCLGCDSYGGKRCVFCPWEREEDVRRREEEEDDYKDNKAVMAAKESEAK